MSNQTTKLLSLAFLFGTIAVAGCHRTPEPVAFEPNLVHAIKFQIRDEIPMEQAIKDTNWMVTELFGTPDEPKIPKVVTTDPELEPVLSMERLMAASGPLADGRGLYRKHCADCHGVSGNGRGPKGAILSPYPRDYRMGIFKFKSTSRGSKPTREDMAKLIRGGITGTAMVKIPELSEEDVQALTDYVIYLSIRGEFERSLISGAVNDLDLESGDRVLDVEFALGAAKNEELMEKLTAITEDTDSDDLGDYEQYVAFGKQLADDQELAAVFASDDDDVIAEEAKKYVETKYPTEKQLSDEIIRLDSDGQETVDDLIEDNKDPKELLAVLVSELADMVIDQRDDYVSMQEDLDDDEDFKTLLMDVSQKTTAEELLRFENYKMSIEIADETIADLAGEWLAADENVVEVPAPPDEIPVANSRAEFVALSTGKTADALASSVKRGQELFTGKVASCSKCHGKTGLGDGQTNDYDDWTKDWTTKVGLKPEDRKSLIPLLARGALPPQNAKPRNFEAGLFHGGSTAADLYRRIMTGIEGSPMPAATFVEGQFQQDDVWHLINFIRSLQKEDEPAATTPADAKPNVTQQAALN